MGMGSISLTSAAFRHGASIPTAHTGDGQDLSPPLAWSGPPAGTRALALLCDDPDAPSREPWVHWVLYDLSGDTTEIPSGLPRQLRITEPVSATHGVNSWPSDNVGYRGPAPPKGHGVHHYHFVLLALDRPLSLPPGVDKRTLLKATEEHVLARGELVGTYRR
jgi:Raf kinase inhibitor-like YbhB/YbcL family protein